ncbi:MAG: TraR/DksA C4-type zinc finger protein [Deltaproteobacteria bacterium]|nr:TraR/DksA C4-type zinc finger protein [Deltaproteobacteria bacterium]
MNKTKLKKFEKILTTQLEELFRGAIQVADDTILSDEKGKLDNVDLASIEIDWINSLRIKDRERNLMLKIKQALRRIDDGSFGVCDSCGEEINEKRLLARPVTTHCVECKEIAEETEQRKGL